MVIMSNGISMGTHTTRIHVIHTIPSTAPMVVLPEVATALPTLRIILGKAANMAITIILTRTRAAGLTMICGSTTNTQFPVA
jgi:hypothetical protein